MDKYGFGPLHSAPIDVMPLIQDWLLICETIHGKCQPVNPNTYPSRVIEITDPGGNLLRLVDGASCNGNYATLSYRWGNTVTSKDYVTVKSNLGTRQIGFYKGLLPQTIQDAITVAQWLDIKYIWIDAMSVCHSTTTPTLLRLIFDELHNTRLSRGLGD